MDVQLVKSCIRRVLAAKLLDELCYLADDLVFAALVDTSEVYAISHKLLSAAIAHFRKLNINTVLITLHYVQDLWNDIT